MLLQPSLGSFLFYPKKHQLEVDQTPAPRLPSALQETQSLTQEVLAPQEAWIWGERSQPS